MFLGEKRGKKNGDFPLLPSLAASPGTLVESVELICFPHLAFQAEALNISAPLHFLSTFFLETVLRDLKDKTSILLTSLNQKPLQPLAVQHVFLSSLPRRHTWRWEMGRKYV